MNYSLTINGLDNAFPREFGCDCRRCMRPERAANTSVSLIGTEADDQVTAFHALIDCGFGISESLHGNPLLRGERARLDWLLFTHWHSDHSAEFNRICAGWMRTCARRGQSFNRVPAWCREGSAQWLAHDFGGAWKVFVEPVIAPGFDDAGVQLAPIPINTPDLKITPITLHHSSADVLQGNLTQRQPACAGFVIQTPARKAVLFWDMDNTNTWITHPQCDAHEQACELARNADLLCIDCNTWRFKGTSSKPASHASFHTHMPNVRALAPRETLLMHLSGHEDDAGDGFGWLDDEWQTCTQVEWQKQGMPGCVRVPRIGERIAL
jgi:ribonuclease BN (tRNA processing enzyme)